MLKNATQEASRYFGPQYLARDLFGNLIVTSLYAVIAYIIIQPFRANLNQIFDEVYRHNVLSEFGVGIAVVLSLTAVGYIANGIYNTVLYVSRKWIFKESSFGYHRIYERNEASIDKIYKMIIEDDSNLCEDPESGLRLGAKVDRILKYLEYIHPDGYVCVYRYYMFVSIIRQAFIYTILLLAAAITAGNAAIDISVLVLMIIALGMGIKRSIKETVITEYDYILTVIHHNEQLKRKYKIR